MIREFMKYGEADCPRPPGGATQRKVPETLLTRGELNARPPARGRVRACAIVLCGSGFRWPAGA
jgi:hypothetical protein